MIPIEYMVAYTVTFGESNDDCTEICGVFLFPKYTIFVHQAVKISEDPSLIRCANFEGLTSLNLV